MKARHLLFLLVVFMFFFSMTCGVSSLHPVDSTVIFKITEGYPMYDCNCQPVIVLSMETEKIYGCMNFLIESQVKRLSADGIRVDLLGIKEPEVCLTALGPATFTAVLDLEERSYDLLFVNGLSRDSYLLHVKPDVIQVEDQVTAGNITRPSITTYWRYPQDSFVYLCGTTEDTTWICDDFFNRLSAEIELEEFVFPDYGEICYPRSSEGYHYDMPARYFIYQSEADFDRAGEILEGYTHEVLSVNPGVMIWLKNWKDKSFRSWLF